MLTREKVDEARPDETAGDGAPPRRPFWPVALLLFGLVVAMLGAALLLDRQFRTPLTIEPVPTSATTGQSTAAPTSAQAAAPKVAPTATTASAPTVAATPATSNPTAGSTAIPATAPSPTLAAGSVAPTPVSTASARATLEQLPPLHREIAEAYLRYWDVLTQARFELDTSRLGEVLAGAELERTQNDIRKLRTEGRAGRLEVELHFRIVQATPDEAVIADEYVNRSVYVDAVTKQEIPTKEPPGVVKIFVQMKKIDGVWKVVDVALYD